MSTKEHKLWVSAERFYLEQNNLLWLRAFMEKKQEEKDATANMKDEEEREITVSAKEEEEDGQVEQEEERKPE